MLHKLIYYSDNVADLSKATTLKVHFKDLTCIKYRRDMYMTWDGLLGLELLLFLIIKNTLSCILDLAAFGGIFGLCLGGSVISLVEMIYYFTLRLYNRIMSIRKQDAASVTRQVTPADQNNQNNNKMPTFHNGNHHHHHHQTNQNNEKLKKTPKNEAIQKSKLQLFEKANGDHVNVNNGIVYNPFGVGGIATIKRSNQQPFLR